MTNCPSCSQKLQSRFEFCPFCGETINRHRFTAKHIFTHFLEGFTHLDFKIINYIKLVFSKPWVIVYEFLHGKQKKFFSPYIAFVIAAGILTFIMHKTTTVHNDIWLAKLEIKKSSMPIVQYEGIKASFEKRVETTEKMLSINKYFHVLNLFMYAMPFWFIIFLFQKKAYNYIETVFAFLVFWTPVLYFYGFIEIVNIFYFIKKDSDLIHEQIGSILISIFVGYSFYKLLNLKPIYWFLGYALLFYLLDNFVASYFIKSVYQIFNLM